ncbi:uncharacterized protein IL334_007590 [Kwoniella shivajii]|uniref:NADH:ubiquinone oxidoreductase intermediate-associated protein 30 domain-containing protein n=1 Tax=Kwoniella shivajii TaxID=564305 RepID=A0ABZ1DAH6_9TREE|nr:hypothetical protein IL334_007590 [Kwoniella shivajii]
MASPLKSYLGRSIDLLRRNTARVVKSEPTPQAHPTTVFSFDSTNPPIDEVSQFGHGSDSEVGGLSTCNLSLIPSSSSSSSSTIPTSGKMGEGSSSRSASATSYSHMAFYGFLSTRVPPSQAGKIRTGYAGFRNVSKPTLFGQDIWDLELYSHLKVVVGYRGWEGWRNRWVVNIGIDGRPKSDVFQHRLEIPSSSESTSSRLPLDPLSSLSSSSPKLQFSTIHLPLSSFVLIKKGQIANSPIPLPKSSIRTVGFALLGRDRGDDPELPSTSSQQQQEGLLKSFNLGGWGKTSIEDVEHDPELKALLEEDQKLSSPSSSSGTNRPAEPPRKSVASRPSSGGYHRVGATEATPATTTAGEATSDTAGGTALEEREGYYELCVKSVEAVKWDPEMDGSEGDVQA